MLNRTNAIVLMAAFLLGCGGGETGQTESAAQQTTPAAQATTPQGTPTFEAPSGPIDVALASAGEGYFASRGCSGCHMVTDARMIGPGLKGVTGRREYNWMMAMIVRPDSMLKNDPIAKDLLKEYGTPMVPMGTTREEAHAIYEFLRQASQ
jgi:mono/diheme cytochrome c family protein